MQLPYVDAIEIAAEQREVGRGEAAGKGHGGWQSLVAQGLAGIVAVTLGNFHKKTSLAIT
jgi:hypothetical protein